MDDNYPAETVDDATFHPEISLTDITGYRTVPEDDNYRRQGRGGAEGEGKETQAGVGVKPTPTDLRSSSSSSSSL